MISTWFNSKVFISILKRWLLVRTCVGKRIALVRWVWLLVLYKLIRLTCLVIFNSASFILQTTDYSRLPRTIAPYLSPEIQCEPRQNLKDQMLENTISCSNARFLFTQHFPSLWFSISLPSIYRYFSKKLYLEAWM